MIDDEQDVLPSNYFLNERFLEEGLKGFFGYCQVQYSVRFDFFQSHLVVIILT
jgi:hypothetical protein